MCILASVYEVYINIKDKGIPINDVMWEGVLISSRKLFVIKKFGFV